MDTVVKFSTQVEHVNEKIQEDSSHQVHVSIDASGNYALFECTSREALFELGRTLMHEALFGSGETELYPLVVGGNALVVEGVRLSKDSARVFVHYPASGKY